MSPEDLTEQLRAVTAAHPAAARAAEKKMFGSDAVLIDGNLACGASRKGLLVRVNRDEADELLDPPAVDLMYMRGRGMPGWLRVLPWEMDADDVAAWMRRGLDYAASLPPK